MLCYIVQCFTTRGMLYPRPVGHAGYSNARMRRVCQCSFTFPRNLEAVIGINLCPGRLYSYCRGSSVVTSVIGPTRLQLVFGHAFEWLCWVNAEKLNRTIATKCLNYAFIQGKKSKYLYIGCIISNWYKTKVSVDLIFNFGCSVLSSLLHTCNRFELVTCRDTAALYNSASKLGSSVNGTYWLQ
jgi:hypothetical protein